MKSVFALFFCCFIFLKSSGQNRDLKTAIPDSTKKIQVVEAACGQCQLGLKANGCDLAVRIKGKSYFVDGTSINDHGDAHAEDGFCNSIRKAEIQGEISDNRFKVTYFKLLKKPENKGPKK